MRDYPYQKIRKAVTYIFQVAYKALLDAGSHGIRGSGGEYADFLDADMNGAVIDLIIIGSQLGFESLELIADLRKTFLEGYDSLQGIGLLQQCPQTLLFDGQGFFAAFDICIL